VSMRATSAALSSAALWMGIMIGACGAERGGDLLTGTSWTIVEIEGAPVVDAGDGRPAELAFLDAGRFAASAGCNRILGAAVQDGEALHLTPGPMTKMACPEPVASRETALVRALGTVTSHRRSGDALALLAGNRIVVRLTRKPAVAP
jgi:heat shock protein HslJ